MGLSKMKRRKRIPLSLFIATVCWVAQTGHGGFVVPTARGSGMRPARVAGSRLQLAGVSVEKMEKHPRLPVWPAWFGIVYILLDLLLGKPGVGAWLEDRFGGRVCPMIFRDTSVSDPFLLVAHHRHSFNAFDPFRYLFRFLLPEGFPAHPHRGFETVTYVLRGGLVHRDSLGVKKSYGAPKDSSGSGDDAAVQWMTAGSGMLHEEMWRTGDAWESSDQELFQIWVNLPKADKYTSPRMQMLGRDGNSADVSAPKLGVLTEVHERGPVPSAEPKPGVSVRIIAGEADGVRSPIETFSDLAILHVTLQPGAVWTWPKPAGWSCLLYARKGEATLGDETTLQVHHTATLARADSEEELKLAASSEEVEILILAGAPLREPVAMGSNIIMNSDAELALANRDLSRGYFGPIWDHTDDDATWLATVTSHWGRMADALKR
ncbi:unnamed protein product [Symbiodinium natans]|uniref:Pirin N-terminal domain-containing protein n=1 Tax=Symbiodinium natans TaxID=878477 RepID=A0A812LFT3_9DINO|nr:unnamed protein product [Symbiodinium natans]